MFLVVAAHDEAEDECRQHRVPVGVVREDHQDQEAEEDELDLRFDDAVAVATEEPRRDARQSDDQQERYGQEDREPEVRLDEDGRERERRAEIRHERRAHQELADAGVGQPTLDKDGVHDRKRRRRKGGSGDQGRARAPIEEEIGNGRGNDEGPDEGDHADAERSAEAAAHVGRVDFHPGEKREHDRPELGDEVEPFLRLQVKEVARCDTEGELEQGHGHADLDRDDAGDENYGGEDCCELD